MDPAHFNKLFSISNWLFLIPCYCQNSIGDLWNTLVPTEQISSSYYCWYLIFIFVRFYAVLWWDHNLKQRIQVMKLCCCSLENWVLIVIFVPKRLKNLRKRGYITIKRVISNWIPMMEWAMMSMFTRCQWGNMARQHKIQVLSATED